jgi:transposase
MMEKKESEAKAVFARFPGVKHVYVDNDGVYLTRRKGAERISRDEIKKSNKSSKKNITNE